MSFYQNMDDKPTSRVPKVLDERTSLGTQKNLMRRHNFILNFNSLQVERNKYRVRINYRRILQNHIFTNTEQIYMMLLSFERGMFAVS